MSSYWRYTMEIDRPTGIIRTLPGHAQEYEFARGKMMRSYQALAEERIESIYVAIAQKPTKPVLHIYMLVGGEIICRMNIADYQDGTDFELECWDGVTRRARWWIVCAPPVSYPPHPIKLRGFQGFRYTTDLW